MVSRTLSLFTLLIFSLSLGVGCQNQNSVNRQIVATTNIIADVAGQIVQDKLPITTLIKPGQDPHAFEPTAPIVGQLEKASLVFVNGFGLESNLLKIIKTNCRCPVVEVSQKIEPIYTLHLDEQSHHQDDNGKDSQETEKAEPDPHTWLSPLNVSLWVDVILEALQKLDPQHKDFYQQNALAYQERLKELHEEIMALTSAIPQKRRIIVADHASFNYFARTYGFQTPLNLIPSFSSLSEPSALSFKDLISYLKQTRLPAIFISSSASGIVQKLAQNLRQELDYQLQIRHLLTGGLNPKGQAGDNYFNFMKYNVSQIVEGLK